MILCIALTVLLMSCGDVESNPGPVQVSQRATRQSTLSFSPHTHTQDAYEPLARSPPSSQNRSYRRGGRSKSKSKVDTTHEQMHEQTEVMSFLRVMKTEVRDDLRSINCKNDNINTTIDELKA